MNGDYLIEVKDLKKHYNGGQIKALNGITTNIKKGEVVVVIGPSGSGVTDSARISPSFPWTMTISESTST